MRRVLALLGLVALLVACQSAPAAPAASAKPPPAGASGAAAAPAATAPAASAPTAAPTAPPGQETVKIAIPKTLSDAGVSIGLAHGYYQEQGITLDDIYIPTGGEMVSSLATNQIEVGLGAPSAGLFNAIGRGALIKIIGDKGSAQPGFGYVALLVRRDLWDSGQVRSPVDLRGRTIAISGPGVTQQVDVAHVLARAGLTLDDANVTPLPFSDMPQALANGSIDLAYAIEPAVTYMVDQGVAVRWLGADEIDPNEQVSTVLASADFADKRRDVAQRFMVAYVKGLRDYNDAFRKGQNKEEVIQILMDWTGLKERSLYDRMAPAGLNVDGCVNRDSIRASYKWWLDNGLVQAPVDLDRVIDMGFCQHAASVLGPYQQ